MTSALPAELLTMILSEHINDCSTLHSCILVNKSWFSIAIQYLWADPFSLFCDNSHMMEMFKYIARDEKAKILLTSFIECFMSMEEFLKNPAYLTKKHCKHPVFDYSNYLRELDSSSITRVVGNCLFILDSHHRQERERISGRIFLLATQYCQHWHTFSFRATRPLIMTRLSKQLAKKDLSQLKKLTLDTHKPSKMVFDSLAKVAHNIKSLSIDTGRGSTYTFQTEPKDSLQNLIESQCRLRNITIGSIHSDMVLLLQLLKKKAHSLESITLADVTLGLDKDQKPEYIEFPKLKSLDIKVSTSFPTRIMKNLLKLGLPNLRKLAWRNLDLPCATFIHKYGETLVSLEISGGIDDTVCETILQHCPRLTHLLTTLTSGDISAIAVLIARLPHLYSVKLQCSLCFYMDFPLDCLARYKLLQLRELTLLGVYEIGATSLQNFLSKSKPPIELLIIDNQRPIYGKHFDVILDHLGSSLKTLRVNYYSLSAENVTKLERIADFDRFSPNEKLEDEIV